MKLLEDMLVTGSVYDWVVIDMGYEILELDGVFEGKIMGDGVKAAGRESEDACRLTGRLLSLLNYD